jgi:hypothetical protein
MIGSLLYNFTPILFTPFFFKNIRPTELRWKIQSMMNKMPEFCSNPPMSIFMYYTVSIIYMHGNGKIRMNNIMKYPKLQGNEMRT